MNWFKDLTDYLKNTKLKEFDIVKKQKIKDDDE